MGGPARGNSKSITRFDIFLLLRFIDRLGKLQLEGKKFAVFDTYMGKDLEKAVKKIEKQINERFQKHSL